MRAFTLDATHEAKKDFHGQSYKPNESFYIRCNSRIKHRFSQIISQTKWKILMAKLTNQTTTYHKRYCTREKFLLHKLQYYPCTRIHKKILIDMLKCVFSVFWKLGESSIYWWEIWIKTENYSWDFNAHNRVGVRSNRLCVS